MNVIKNNKLKSVLSILFIYIVIRFILSQIEEEVNKKEYDINNLIYTTEYDWEDMESEDPNVDTYTEKFSDKGVSGNIYTTEFNKKVFLGKMKKGKKDGIWTDWYENGRKEREILYKRGKIIEFVGHWNKYGNEWSDEDEPTTKTPITKLWYDNGRKYYEGTWKDGEKGGVWTFWYENGKKEGEGKYIEGFYEHFSPKRDGKWTEWYYNGQKKSEKTWVDGKVDFVENSWDKTGKIMVKDGDGLEKTN